jgi:hypothetical protein
VCALPLGGLGGGVGVGGGAARCPLIRPSSLSGLPVWRCPASLQFVGRLPLSSDPPPPVCRRLPVRRRTTAYSLDGRMVDLPVCEGCAARVAVTS